MGTRNLTIVYKDGDYKVAQYGQWDGYPEGLGVNILKFLHDTNMDDFKYKLNKVSFLSKDENEKLNSYIEGRISENPNYEWTKEFPELSRDAGGDILKIILKEEENIKLDNYLNFAADSLFCEYAYVIDLDKNTFEVYEGFIKTPLSEEDRFYFLQERRRDETYYPVKLVKSYALNSLPSEEEFLNDFEEDEDEE